MENKDSQATPPASEPSANPALNISQTPPPANPQKKKFMLILIGFFVIFFLTIGAAAAIYTFKEVSKNSIQQPEKSLTPTPTSTVDIIIEPTISSSTECVVSGCSGQLCVSKSESEGLITTCEYKEEYACYKSATCEIQSSGKCGWTDTPELRSCLQAAQ